jgi:hypothetical protein
VKLVICIVSTVLAVSLLFAASAIGSADKQSSGPSMAQFNALKKQVAKMKTDVRDLYVFIGACFKGSAPVSRFDGYVQQHPDGSTGTRTALDVTAAVETRDRYLLDIGKLFASTLDQPQALRRFRPRG